MIYIKTRPHNISISRPLQWIAAFLLGEALWVVVLIIAISYGVTGEQDYRNEKRIEADRIALCAENHGVGDCNDVPKTNHWRN